MQGLPNDFYPQLELILAPILSHLFNACMRVAQEPPSVLTAYIYTLKSKHNQRPDAASDHFHSVLCLHTDCTDGPHTDPWLTRAVFKLGFTPLTPSNLALQPLYDRIENTIELSGIPHVSHTTGPLVVAGHECAELPILTDILHDFGKVAGLQVNPSKTAIVNLHEDGSILDGDYHTVDRFTAIRYLGVPSLFLIPPQAGMLCDNNVQGIVIPKLLYVSEHYWPTSAMLQELQDFVHRFIWAGDFRDEPVRAKFCSLRPGKNVSRAHYGYSVDPSKIWAPSAQDGVDTGNHRHRRAI
ncbi:TPA: LOW QUALITY PROTEIN: hypothetical protein N0F65_004009 [Lagenidium giganteum]|uniref:Uncharacterized protein n=1 Tax=Lagenidium giganteum TaxID=4803 RepID=A0AAV2YYE1_9STRA|nr:TPA: LOW QUALITY PROTEIN: hypothetical protein N0F65_004009 [Lagenidium giganteum]